jgi:hypothetical protein
MLPEPAPLSYRNIMVSSSLTLTA